MHDDGLTNELTGKYYEWQYSSGMQGSVRFTADRADWSVVDGPSGSNEYKARVVGEGVYFVQWHEPEFKTTVTLLINEGTMAVYSSVAAQGLEFDVGVIGAIEGSTESKGS